MVPIHHMVLTMEPHSNRMDLSRMSSWAHGSVDVDDLRHDVDVDAVDVDAVDADA